MTRPTLKLSRPERLQTGWHAASLDELIPDDHRVRVVWRFVEGLDLSALEEQVRSHEGGSGRPAIDPRLLLGLWLYATVDGVGSARLLARQCEEALPYRWLCGGVSVNYHTLADFRVGHQAFLSDLLTRSVGALLHQGLVRLERVAQDGVRVRTAAGAPSFRRRSTLRECLREARAQVAALEQELATDPGNESLRRQAARIRAATEREQRVQQALAAAEAMTDRTDEEARASTTDPEARIMKMPDGGFRPAYNIQFATDAGSRLIVGVAATTGGDQPQLVPMLEQLVERYGRPPTEHVVDGGYFTRNGVIAAEAIGTTLYAPPPKARDGRDPAAPLPTDHPSVAAWRARMASDAGKAVYRERASLAEWANALARNRGLTCIRLRGLAKATTVALWFALAHNLMQMTGG